MFTLKEPQHIGIIEVLNGGSGENRTLTSLRILDFESEAKTKTDLCNWLQVITSFLSAIYANTSKILKNFVPSLSKISEKLLSKITKPGASVRSNITVSRSRCESVLVKVMTNLMTTLLNAQALKFSLITKKLSKKISTSIASLRGEAWLTHIQKKINGKMTGF